MSRRRKVYKKEEKVDSRYGSPAVARLISTVMKRGKKSLAERMVYTAIDKSREGSDSVDPLEVLNKALENVRPRLEVKSRRVGGATYQVPMEVAPARQISLAMRWIVQYADNRRGQPMADSLAQEIKDAAAGQGQRDQKTRGHTQNGAGQPRFRAFPLVILWQRRRWKRNQLRRIRIRRSASSRWSEPVTSALPPTSTQARPRSPSASFFTPA
jgi:small subunit ribosomal protein S7